MADARGNLALEYLRLADRLRPRWLVWENVPGVLSSNGGRDFGSFLGGLGQLGYGFTYRVLDAQYLGLAQRRKRVFVVGYLGDWRRAAAVLLEPASLHGNPPPRREAGEGSAGTVAGVSPGGGWRCGADEAAAGQLIPSVATALRSRDQARGVDSDCTDTLLAFGGNDTRGPIDVATACNAHGGPMGRLDFESETFVAHALALPLTSNPYGDHESRDGLLVAHSLRGEGFDASEDGTGRGTPLVPVAFQQSQSGMRTHDTHATLDANNGSRRQNGVMAGSAVRRLMPHECERLQGFPESKKFAIVAQCPSDHQKTAALAEVSNLKSPLSAWIADDLRSARFARNAETLSSIPFLGCALPVALRVLIDLEREEVRILKAEKLLWSASAANTESQFPLLMPIASFVRLAALLTRAWEPETQDGRAALPLSTTPSTPLLSGSGFALLSGPQTEAVASDAMRLTSEVNRFITSTTLQAGRDIQSCGQTWETLASCVSAAIGSCIPQETQSESSYALLIETTAGYTAIPWRGGTAPDGPRYKALGNSMAVNVMAWIGRRIAAEDAR